MAIPTRESLIGFIASEPRLTHNSRGGARFYARVGHETWRRNEENGSFTQEGLTYHNLVQFGKSAEHAYAVFKPGDRFVAEGYTRPYTLERNGESEEIEEFVAQRLGHDCAYTTYTVDRTPRTQRAEREQATPAGGASSTPSVGTEPNAGAQPANSRQQQLPPVGQPTPTAATGPYGQPLAI